MSSVKPLEKFHVNGTPESVHNRFGEYKVEQNPWLARNDYNSGHQDSWCTESVSGTGPTSNHLAIIRKHNPYGFMPIMGCNLHGQMIGMCHKLDGFNLVVYNENCKILSATPTGKAGKSFAGGYFYVDKDYNAVSVGDNTIKCLPTGKQLDDLGYVQKLEPLWESDDIVKLVSQKLGVDQGKNSLYSSLPVWQANEPLFWCLLAGNFNGTTGVLSSEATIALVKINPTVGEKNTTVVHAMKCEKQWNNNTFAVDKDGAYFVTNGIKENRFKSYIWKVGIEARKIKLLWKTQYENDGILKLGQTNIGSGTTPTIIDGGNLVTITDNASPQINVCVYTTKDGKTVSKTPVFSKMRSAAEASLIGVGKYIVVENNFGHATNTLSTQLVANEPGMTMIKLAEQPDKDGNYSSEVIWDDNTASYLAMTMLARKNGIIYAITGDWSGDESATEGAVYYMNAKDSYDGRVIWRIPLGRGKTFAHDYGGIYFNQTGKKIYVGTQDYIICIQDVARN